MYMLLDSLLACVGSRRLTHARMCAAVVHAKGSTAVTLGICCRDLHGCMTLYCSLQVRCSSAAGSSGRLSCARPRPSREGRLACNSSLCMYVSVHLCVYACTVYIYDMRCLTPLTHTCNTNTYTHMHVFTYVHTSLPGGCTGLWTLPGELGAKKWRR